ncbi:unnamed protein product [Trichobilharzia regenti]|nr:unnamed protein product [Trichobilharzia regenti]
MFLILSILVCTIHFQYNRVNAEYYTAIVDITKAWRLSQELVSDLNSYIALEETRLNEIRKVIKLLDTVESVNDSTTTPYQQNNKLEEYLGNPINAYLTMKRLSSNWKSKLSQLVDNVSSDPSSNDDGNSSDDLNFSEMSMNTIRSRVKQHTDMLPGDNDVNGAVDAILRLQSTYKLPASRLAYGQLIDKLSCPQLSAAQCLEVGKQAYSQGDYERSEEWFRVAYDRLFDELEEKKESGIQASEEDATVNDDIDEKEVQPTVGQILDHLAYSLGRQGRYAEALNVTRLLIEQEPTNIRAIKNEAYYVEQISLGEGRIGPNPRPEECAILGSSKQQLDISSFYGCRNDGLTWKLLNHCKLRRATVKNPVTGNLEVAFYRTSKSAWIPHSTNEITDRISKRIRAVTGLSLETAEDLQVGNYGLGGHYAPHFDFGRKREKDAFEVQNGNRIATIIFYLSDIQAGGATVFNRIGARVVPKQGAASFWFNLLPSGEGDLRTRHAACPVLAGSKWVMNLWFHERGQEFLRPCELERGTIEVDDGL